MSCIQSSLLLYMWSRNQQDQPHLEALLQAPWVRICIFNMFPRDAYTHDGLRCASLGNSVTLLSVITDREWIQDTCSEMEYVRVALNDSLTQTKNRRDLATPRPKDLKVLASSCRLDWIGTRKQIPPPHQKWRRMKWQRWPRWEIAESYKFQFLSTPS